MSPSVAREVPDQHPRSSWAWLLTALVPLLLFAPLVLSGRAFLPLLPVAFEPLASELPEEAGAGREATNYAQADRTYQFLTDQAGFRAALADGELPLWEPNWALGAPLLAETILGAAYPPNWLGLVFAPERMAAPLAALSLFLGGLGLWLFLGRLGLSSGARVVAVIAFQLGGFGITNLYYYMKVDAALWLPWALWAVEGIARGRRGSGFALALALACSLLAGMVTIGVFVVVFTGLYGLVRWLASPRWFGGGKTEEQAEEDAGARRSLPPVLYGSIFLVLGGLGGALQLLPILEASGLSIRKPGGADTMVADALPLGTGLGTVVSDLFGVPTDPAPPGGLPVAWWLTPAHQATRAEGANTLEWNAFAGLAVVLLALVGLCADPRRAWLPALLLAGVFGFAQAWPVVRWAYVLPGMNAGLPGRILALAWTLWPWLAALGVEALQRQRHRALTALVLLSMLAVVLSGWSWLSLDPATWGDDLVEAIHARYADTHAPTREEIALRLPPEGNVAAATRLEEALGLTFGASFTLLACAGVLLALRRRHAQMSAYRIPTWLLFSALAVTLGVCFVAASERSFTALGAPPRAALAGAGGLLLALIALAPRKRPTDQRWVLLAFVVLTEGLLASHGHVTGRRVGESGLWPETPATNGLRTALGDGRLMRFDASENGLDDVLALLRPNLGQAYGFADLTPYIIFPPETYTRLFEALDARTRFRQGVARIPDVGLVGHPLLDLLRVSVVLSRAPLEHARLELAFERPGFFVYRRSGTLGPARVVGQMLPASSDDAALALLTNGPFDPQRQVVIAPESVRGAQETAALAGGFGEGVGQPSTITSFRRPARTEVEIDVAGDGGILVWHEQHYPGWKASIDGASAPLLRADHVYQALVLPAGEHRVRFRYAPASVRNGLVLTLGALSLALILSLFFDARARSSPR